MDVATDRDSGSDAPPSVDTGRDAPAFGPDSPDVSPDVCVPRCVDADLVSCTGAPTPCALGCIEAPTPHCGQMVVSNVADLDAVPLAFDLLELSLDTVVDTSSCMVVSPVRLNGTVVSLAGETEGCVFRVGALVVSEGVTISATGSRPIIVIADTSIDMGGNLSVDARGAMGGAGSGTGGNPGGAGSRVGTSDSGGGGGGLGTAGGAGGDATGTLEGRGGAAVTPLAFEPLLGGGAGGIGSAGTGPPNPGGAGGGAFSSRRSRAFRSPAIWARQAVGAWPAPALAAAAAAVARCSSKPLA